MNLKKGVAGFAVQADQGAPEAQPAFAGPVGGGKLTVVEVEQVEDELTSADIGSVGEYRESAAFSGEWEGRAWPASLGGLLFAVLGAEQVAGALAPYTHTITAAAELPWCTVFGEKDTERKAIADAKCDSLKIEWEGNAPLKVTPAWLGLDVSWSDAAFIPDLDERAVAYLKGAHLTLATIDLDGTAKDGGATLQGGSVEIKRNLTADTKSGQLEPSGANEGAFECTVELKCRVPDLAAVRLLLTGALDGESVTSEVPYGDFTLTFADAAASLSLAATRVAWQTSEPDADPKGGPGELTLQGRCYGNPPLTAVVINAVAAY